MKIIKSTLFVISPLIFLLILPAFILLLFKKPSHNRDWELGQEKMVNFTFFENEKSRIKIKNFRDFDWNNGKISNWIEKDINSKDITGVDIAITHALLNGKFGHVFLIFNLSDGSDVGVSIEARRDGGEKFTIIGGLKFDYELIYVFATKNDLLNLRNIENEEVYLYKTKASANKSQLLLKALINKANELNKTPKFYHLFFRNCANLITDELKGISNKKFSFVDTSFFLPNIASRTFFNMGFIKTDKDSFEEVREEFLVKFDE